MGRPSTDNDTRHAAPQAEKSLAGRHLVCAAQDTSCGGRAVGVEDLHSGLSELVSVGCHIFWCLLCLGPRSREQKLGRTLIASTGYMATCSCRPSASVCLPGGCYQGGGPGDVPRYRQKLPRSCSGPGRSLAEAIRSCSSSGLAIFKCRASLPRSRADASACCEEDRDECTGRSLMVLDWLSHGLGHHSQSGRRSAGGLLIECSQVDWRWLPRNAQRHSRRRESLF